MSISTGVSASLMQPRVFHRFTFSFRTGTLIALPHRIALIGMMRSTGTATVNTVYEVTDAEQTDALFGIASELAIGCRKALDMHRRIGQGPRIYAVPIAAPSGAANVKTITGVGSASADGMTIIRVAGRRFFVGVLSGQSAATQATAISNELKKKASDLPVLVTVSGAVVTLTHPTTGINGVDVAVSVDQQTTGTVQTVAVGTAGTGVADHQPALDALAAGQYDAIAMANHASADITEVVTDIASSWGVSTKRWRYYIFGEMGTIGTAAALAASANHQGAIILTMEGCLSTALEMSAAAAVAIYSVDRPNAIYNQFELALYPPAAATLYTPTEVETAIAAGLTPLNGTVNSVTQETIDGVCLIERLITTKTTENSQPFKVLADIGVSRTAIYFARQIDAAYAARFTGNANPDNTLQSDDTLGQLRDMIESIGGEMQDGNILRLWDQDKVGMKLERNEVSPGRTDSFIPYTVVLGQHQLANVHSVQI